MISPPTFASDQDYALLLGDADFWWPYVAEVLKRHKLEVSAVKAHAGEGGTYPTILYGDVVVKLFGHVKSWRRGYGAEQAAQALIATDPAIAAPRLLGDGYLFDRSDAPWPYLVTSRMHGVSWQEAGLSGARHLSIAKELGEQIRRVHALEPRGIATQANLPALDMTSAAAQSSLPAHLVAQVDSYLARLGSFDPVFVHGDLFERHVFVAQGRLSGIIDWGDATVTDRHYELAKLHLDTFQCDRSLLRAFLEAADWPVGKDFPQMAMGLALQRQAIGLTQHLTNDTFHRLPTVMPLQDIDTLEELAIALFAV